MFSKGGGVSSFGLEVRSNRYKVNNVRPVKVSFS